MRALALPLASLALLVATLLAAADASAQTTCTPLSRDGFQPGPASFAQASATGTSGQDGSFDVQGPELHLRGVTLAITTPVAPGAIIAAPYALFGGADVAGRGAGDVVVEGPTIGVSGGTIALGSLARADVDATAAAIVPARSSASPTIPAALATAWPQAQAVASTWKPLIGASASGLALSSFTRAVFFPADGGAPQELSAPVTLTSAAVIAGGSDTDADAIVVRAASASVSAARFLLAGEATSSSVTIDGATSAVTVTAIAGVSTTIALSPGRAQGTDAHVTQVIDAGGPRIDATVAARIESFVHVAPGGKATIGGQVRELSNEGVALFESLEVDGCVPVQIVTGDDASPFYVAQLVETVVDAGWAAPLVAVAIAPALPFIIIADVLCVLFGCSSGPDEYPVWLEPGTTKPFDLSVSGDVPEGDYPTVVRIVGENHATIELRFLVRVGAGITPAEWTCGAGLYGTYEDCDCGCGTVDLDCASAAHASCDREWCGRPRGVRPDLIDPGDSTACLEPADTWLCATSAQSDPWCDCGCGMTDAACERDVRPGPAAGRRRRRGRGRRRGRRGRPRRRRRRR